MLQSSTTNGNCSLWHTITSPRTAGRPQSLLIFARRWTRPNCGRTSRTSSGRRTSNALPQALAVPPQAIQQAGEVVGGGEWIHQRGAQHVAAVNLALDEVVLARLHYRPAQ